MLQPDLYFPCLAPLEKAAIRAVYDAFVPTYFVVPVADVDALYAGSSDNFDGRQQAFENMFDVTRVEVEIFPGLPEVLCYSGFYEFYLTWLLYDPIAYDTPGPACRQFDYSPTSI